MSRPEKQKLKLLRLKEIFERKTDSEHHLTLSEITQELEKFGITAERKSLYRDIELLRKYGMDIQAQRAKHYSYYLAERCFESVELKLLADAVASSKFIAKRQSDRIIKKLGSLDSEYNEARLKRQLYIEKSTREETSGIYFNIDAIYNAIDSDSKISFRYFDYNRRKMRDFRHNGEKYIMSPWALVWNDGMYYLVCYDSAAEIIRHFRVDKMDSPTQINEKREGKRAFRDFDMDQYTKEHFGMFGGKIRTVELICHNSMSNIIIDRFGKNAVRFYDVDEKHFKVNIIVVVSPVFLSWAAGFGDKLIIKSPKDVREEFKAMINNLVKIYADAE